MKGRLAVMCFSPVDLCRVPESLDPAPELRELLYSPPVRYDAGQFPFAPGPLASWMNKAKAVRTMARGAIRSIMEGGGKYGEGTCKAWEIMVSTQNLCCPSSIALVEGQEFFSLGSIIPWNQFSMRNNDFSVSPAPENWARKVGWKEFQLLAV